jgi:hypothetical protein
MLPHRGLPASTLKTDDPFLNEGFAFTTSPTKKMVGLGCRAQREH